MAKDYTAYAEKPLTHLQKGYVEWLIETTGFTPESLPDFERAVAMGVVLYHDYQASEANKERREAEAKDRTAEKAKAIAEKAKRDEARARKDREQLQKLAEKAGVKIQEPVKTRTRKPRTPKHFDNVPETDVA